MSNQDDSGSITVHDLGVAAFLSLQPDLEMTVLRTEGKRRVLFRFTGPRDLEALRDTFFDGSARVSAKALLDKFRALKEIANANKAMP